ncbi:RING/U-box superfamily protein [Rhynchospora pubera]|uniref:RING/U-box superfamily protein n=1 Tax=Rhynchospora pubera TaxID=906938 RepID=A0AAV8DJX8_9POAL|nr:RING/U-box superfamily protein [Rhynchospora pubera]
MALSIFASIGVDVAVVVGIIIIVFSMLFLIGRLVSFIKTCKSNRKLEQDVLPQHNTMTRTLVTSRRSRAIAPEPREQPNITHSVADASMVAFTYHESEHDGCVECVVCLCPLQEGDTVLQLPVCGHLLHDICICSWFFANSICPGCGTPVEGQFTVNIGAV